LIYGKFRYSVWAKTSGRSNFWKRLAKPKMSSWPPLKV